MTGSRYFFFRVSLGKGAERFFEDFPLWLYIFLFFFIVLRVAGGDATVMAGKRRISSIDGLAGEVLADAGQTRRQRIPALTTAREEITRLENREYARSLRGFFSLSEVREIVREARAMAWPRLTREAVRLGSMREFAARASSLGADFQIAKMSWPSG